MNDLKESIVEALKEGLKPLLEDATSDLNAYAENLVTIALEAAAAGDQDTLDQLADQAKALAEANRIRFANRFLDTAERVTQIALAIGIKMVMV